MLKKLDLYLYFFQKWVHKEKYNEIWGNNSDPAYNEKYLRTKIKSTQIFTIIKYQTKALNVFAYH